MGRRARAKQRQLAAADTNDAASRLRGMPGLIWLLFESPSGFAIFVINGSRFEVENPVQHIWANFVKDYMATFGITCTCDDIAMELMWGIKNLMHVLVPQEQKVLTKEERLPMSKGLEMTMRRHGIVANLEMVNDDIVETACFLYDCDMCVSKHSKSLHMLDTCLFEISGFKSIGWDTMKLATALKKISCPEEEVEHSAKMFSQDELLKIKKDADKYKNKICKESISQIYTELVYAYKCMDVKLEHMRYLVTKTQEAGSQNAQSD